VTLPVLGRFFFFLVAFLAPLSAVLVALRPEQKPLFHRSLVEVALSPVQKPSDLLF
jgi:hypothetical protein